MVGKHIAHLRKQAGLTQFELAKRLNIGTSTVGMYEQDRREPSASMLISISRVFGVTLDYLLTGEQLPTLGSGVCPCSICKLSDTSLQVLFDLSMAGTKNGYSVVAILLQRSSNKEHWTDIMAYTRTAEELGNTDGLRAGCFVYAGTPGYFYRVSIKYCSNNGEENDCTYTAMLAC